MSAAQESYFLLTLKENEGFTESLALSNYKAQ
jgi:hypothetical protein